MYLYPTSTFSVVGQDHPLIHGALHGTPMHFCYVCMLFTHVNTVSLYGLPYLNKVSVTITPAWEMFVPSYMYIYTPHLMATFTSTSHAFKHVQCTTFPTMSHFFSKKYLLWLTKCHI